MAYLSIKPKAYFDAVRARPWPTLLDIARQGRRRLPHFSKANLHRFFSRKLNWFLIVAIIMMTVGGSWLAFFKSRPKTTNATYQFSPMSGNLVTGTEQAINSAAAALAEGVNTGSWKGTLAADNYQWVIASTTAGYDVNLVVGNVALHGANTLMIETSFDLDATVPTTYVQICDWVSSTGVDDAADAQCTDGGWRTLNVRGLGITASSATNYHYQIYDGYWGDGATAFSTPLTDFVNGSNQIKIRYYSLTNTTSQVALDFLRVYAIINPVYSPAGFTNFNTNTGSITDVSASEWAEGVANDATYMYVVGGDSTPRWRIEKRFLGTGGFDYKFGTSGVVTGSSPSTNAYDIATDSTYMYVVGADSNPYWRIEKRRLYDGSVDSNFGTSGVVTSSSGTYASAIATDSTYMYVVGQEGTAPTAGHIEKRKLSDGTVDDGFGTNGMITTGSAAEFAIAIKSPYMYIIGNASNNYWRIEKRLLSDGTTDNGFGTNGVVTVSVFNLAWQAFGIAIDNTYMYIAGQNVWDWRIEKRYLSDGSLKSDFGTNGVVTCDSSTDIVFNIVIDSTSLYVMGADATTDWRIEKRALSDGTLDNGFGTGGVVTGVAATHYAYDAVLDSTYLYVVGDEGNNPYDWHIEKRKLSDGTFYTDPTGNDGFGLAMGGYSYTTLGVDGVTVRSSDNIYNGVAGNANSIADFSYSFKNIKTYTGMNTIMVRAETSCDVVGINYRPKIYKFSNSTWYDLTSSDIACSATDATNIWAINNATLADYLSSGEMRIGFYGKSNGTQTIRVDYAYIMLGTTNTDTGVCEISFGTNSANDCANTRDIDTSGTTNTWSIATEDESNTFGHAFYALDNDADVNVEEAAASHVKFSVTQPANSVLTGAFYASRMMSGVAGTVQTSLADYTGFTGTTGGFTDVGTTSTTAQTFTDNVSYTATAGIGNLGIAGVINNPSSYQNNAANQMWLRLRTSVPGAIANNSVNQWDFAMVSLQWVEDSSHPSKQFQYNPTDGNLVTGTAQNILAATAAAAEGINVGSWKGTLADDNLHWVIASTTGGFDMNLVVGNFALHGANSLIIQTELDLDATVPNTYVQICDWASATGVDNAADAQCTTGGWRTLNVRKVAITTATATAYHFQIYNGYWGDGSNPINTPLTDFVNGSNQVKVRYFSATNTTSQVSVDHLRIIAEVNPIYSPSGFTNVNTNGGVITSVAASDVAQGIAKDSTYMYVAGGNNTPDLRIEKRLLGTGILDPNFGTAGVITGASSSLYAYAIAIDTTYMYVAGGNDSGAWRIEKRRLSDGTVDNGFGTSGVIEDASSTWPALAIAIDSTYMYIAGSVSNATRDWMIEKRALSDGAVDNGFGTNGIITGAGASYTARGIAIDGTHMYIAGDGDASGWRIEKRALSDGTVDNGFGTNGVIAEDGIGGYGKALAIAGSYMYVVGNDYSGGRIEKRALSDGTVDNGFGTNGFITGAGSEFDSIALDATYMYVAGMASNDWRIEKRALSDGTVDNGFGTNGVITGAAASWIAFSIAINGTYMYVVGEDGTPDWRMEKRRLSDGTYDNSSSGNTGFGLAQGGYANTVIGVGQAGSDDVRSGAAGTAASIPDFYYTFKNIKTYTGMNTLVVRAEHSCSAIGINYRPKIWNFTYGGGAGRWEDLTTGSIQCNVTDYTDEWAKNNITISDYVSSGEARIGFYGLSNGTQTIQIDQLYLVAGSTVGNDTGQCEVSFGTNNDGDCTRTQDLDTTGTHNIWKINKEDESTNFSHAFYAFDNDVDADAEASGSANMKISVTAPSGSPVTSIFFGFGFMAGKTYSAVVSGTLQGYIYDYSGFNQVLGGFNGAWGSATTAIAYQDNVTAGGLGSSGTPGLTNNPEDHIDTANNIIWLKTRLSTSGIAGTGTNVPMQLDFAFTSIAWVE